MKIAAVVVLSGILLLAGCGPTDPERALQLGKDMIRTGALSDTDTIEHLQTSEKLLDEIVQIKIDAARWRVHALRRLVEKYMQMGMLEPAAEELEKLIGLQPMQPRWYVMKGQLYSRWAIVDSDKIPEAEEAFLIALELEPDSLPGRYGLGILYAFYDGRVERGREILREIAFEEREIVRTRGYIKQARFALSRLEFESTNYHEASRILRDIVDMKGISRDSRFMAYKNLGQVYERTGARELAVQSYRQAHKLYEYDNQVNRALARLSP